MSEEFKRLYPTVLRAFELIPLICTNRLTLVDNFVHKATVAKIYYDHKRLRGFSQRNIRRHLPLDNEVIPRRVRPFWPKNRRASPLVVRLDRAADAAIHRAGGHLLPLLRGAFGADLPHGELCRDLRRLGALAAGAASTASKASRGWFGRGDLRRARRPDRRQARHRRRPALQAIGIYSYIYVSGLRTFMSARWCWAWPMAASCRSIRSSRANISARTSWAPCWGRPRDLEPRHGARPDGRRLALRHFWHLSLALCRLGRGRRRRRARGARVSEAPARR